MGDRQSMYLHVCDTCPSCCYCTLALPPCLPAIPPIPQTTTLPVCATWWCAQLATDRWRGHVFPACSLPSRHTCSHHHTYHLAALCSLYRQCWHMHGSSLQCCTACTALSFSSSSPLSLLSYHIYPFYNQPAYSISYFFLPYMPLACLLYGNGGGGSGGDGDDGGGGGGTVVMEDGNGRRENDGGSGGEAVWRGRLMTMPTWACCSDAVGGGGLTSLYNMIHTCTPATAAARHCCTHHALQPAAPSAFPHLLPPLVLHAVVPAHCTAYTHLPACLCACHTAFCTLLPPVSSSSPFSLLSLHRLA